jgi:hypothetical protein
MELRNATVAGDTDPSKQISDHAALARPHWRRNFVKHVAKPDDPLFRHFLTEKHHAARFGAGVNDYRIVVGWAKSHGLTPEGNSAGHGKTRTSRSCRA